VNILAAEPPNVLVPPIAELVVGGLAFLIVFGALLWKLLPKLTTVLDQRAETIEGGIARAEEAQAEAQKTLEQYRSQLAEARHEAARLREEARQQGSAIIAEMREQAQSEAQRLTAQAHQQIDAERKQALASLRADVGRLSVDLASRVVGEALEDDARQRRTIDRFLAEIETSSDASSTSADSTAGGVGSGTEDAEVARSS
jgi:F-type H+-transporting ATPase subunit b